MVTGGSPRVGACVAAEGRNRRIRGGRKGLAMNGIQRKPGQHGAAIIAIMMAALLWGLGGCTEEEGGKPKAAHYYTSGSCCHDLTSLTYTMFTYTGPSAGTVSNPYSHVYAFTTTKSRHTISVSELNGNTSWYLYDGASSSATMIGFCDFTYSTTAPRRCTAGGLTIGTTHYVEVYPWAGNMDYLLEVFF